jgi:RNA polymerase sigma-70 factor (ECF subfamily)
MFDTEIIKKAREGDKKSVELVCRDAWEPLYRFIYYKVQNREEAEDITQETFVRALSYKRLDEIGPEKFMGFLKTVALNIIRDGWRQKKRRGKPVDIDAVNPMETAIDDPAEARTLRITLEKAMQSLTEEQRSVLEFRIIKGYSAAETGRALGRKESTVRVLQHRALRALAVILKEME